MSDSGMYSLDQLILISRADLTPCIHTLCSDVAVFFKTGHFAWVPFPLGFQLICPHEYLYSENSFNEKWQKIISSKCIFYMAFKSNLS